MPTEPSVLDYLLAKLQFWKKSEIDFEPYLRDDAGVVETQPSDGEVMEEIGAIIENQPEPEAPDAGLVDEIVTAPVIHFPWRLLVSLTLSFSGQFFMVEPHKKVALALILYAISAGLLIWSFMEEELHAPVFLSSEMKATIQQPAKQIFLFLSIPLLITAFVLMGQNTFTAVNLILWGIGVVFLINGIWVDSAQGWKQFSGKIQQVFTGEFIHLRIRWFDVLLILLAVIAVFYRTNLLDSVPAEMFSDHAEKLLDVQDVLDGQYSIFFPRNTGREAFQMYLSAFVARFFGVGIQFLTLKIGTVLCGLLMLPYIYLLGKEIANKWVGVYAVFFASIAYWPNVIARVGLRYILYAAFAAPVMYYLIRGLKRQHRNNFVLAGIFLGIGLHGYSSFRFVPVLVVVVALLYLLHNLKEKANRKTAVLSVLIIAMVSLAIFVPLLRYWLANPAMFSYRMATRIGTAETNYPGNPIVIFFDNLLKALLMFFNDNGEIWVHSVTNRPALDWITAGLYFIGGLVMFLDYFKKWSWEYLSLLVSIPLLLMPSVLSLAFPDENPCLNRTSAAMIPVFILAGFGLDAIVRSIRKAIGTKGAKTFTVFLVLLLCVLSAGANYDLVFNQYADQFVRGAWNTSDIGKVISDYAESFGSYDSAYVIPYPHWVDTRLVGINAGAPRKDYALSSEFIPETLAQEGTKLFIFRYDDTQTLDTLESLYPEGKLKFYDDQYEGKDFYIFLVP